MTHFEIVESPLGPLFVGGTDAAVQRIDFLREGEDESAFVEQLRDDTGDAPAPSAVAGGAAAEQLREYFDGERAQFDLPLAPHGTAFQRAVWRALEDIPHGETVSYGDIAAELGRAGMRTAPRAVGSAVGRNPLSIVIPCHRVVGSDGSLTGYGGGLHRKRWLLDHEAPVSQQRMAV